MKSIWLFRLLSLLGRRVGGRPYCWLGNLRSRIFGLRVVFSFDRNSGFYCAREENSRRFFLDPTRGDHCYRHGVVLRGNRLAKSYHYRSLDFSDGDVIVDCGANLGDLKLWFDQQGFDIDYIGIEPSPTDFRCLTRNVPNGRCLQLGLWNENGLLPFYLDSRNADSSFIKTPGAKETIEVEVKRLDQLLDDAKAIKLLKVEAEGGELEVLQGAEGILPRIQYICADLGPERGLKQENTVAAVTNFLLARGFELKAFSHKSLSALFERRA